MRRFILVLMLMSGLLVAEWAHATVTYTFTGPYYGGKSEPTKACPSGQKCELYTAKMRITGSFTVASALPPNKKDLDIKDQLLSWSFNDGLNTISSTGVDPWVQEAYVDTDGAGNISASASFVNWQPAAGANNYYNMISVLRAAKANSPISSFAETLIKCIKVDSPPICNRRDDNDGYTKTFDDGGTWVSSAPLAAVPTAASGSAGSLIGVWDGEEDGYDNNVYTDNEVEYAVVEANGNAAVGYKLEKKQGAADWEKVSSASFLVRKGSKVATNEQGPTGEGTVVRNKMELELEDPATNGELIVRATRTHKLPSFVIQWPLIPAPLDKDATEEEKLQYKADLETTIAKLDEIEKSIAISGSSADEMAEYAKILESIRGVLAILLAAP